jgi:CheY-like chemotaxis protein
MKKKILVVDDDKAIHAFLRAILQKDYDVISAVDGLQGVTMARQGKPDLVLLDLQMPAGGGSSVFERLGMMTDTSLIPILVLTASPLEEALRRVPGLRPEQVLVKPAAPKAILEAVAAAMGA